MRRKRKPEKVVQRVYKEPIVLEKAEKRAEKAKQSDERLEKMRDKVKDKSGPEADDVESDEDVEIIMANSIEELQSKIEAYNFNLRANSVQAPMEKMVGQSIDFKG